MRDEKNPEPVIVGNSTSSWFWGISSLPLINDERATKRDQGAGDAFEFVYSS